MMPATMPAAERRLRWSVVALSAAVAVGALAELTLVGHWREPVMLAPLVVALGSLVTAGLVVRRPYARRRTAAAVWTWAGVAVVAAWWGAIEHLGANMSFAQELHPDWTRAHLVLEGLSGGVPLLAPASVALPSVLQAVAVRRAPAAPVGTEPAAPHDRPVLDLAAAFASVERRRVPRDDDAGRTGSADDTEPR